MNIGIPSNLRYAYRYTALPAGQNAIRLLELLPAHAHSARLCGRLSHVTDWTTQSCKYTALSYECGPPERVDTIFIGDHHLGITRNLSVLLRNIRHSTEPLLLWVDAVCINQADDDGGKEKSEQIRKMSQIYTHAHEVIGWIGDRTAIAPAALGYLRLFSQIMTQSDNIPQLTAWLEGHVDGNHVVKSNSNDQSNVPLYFEDIIGQEIGQQLSRGTQKERPSLKIMFEFMNINYWSRLWCVQEAVLNINFSFRYGPNPEHSITIQEMELFQAFMVIALRLPRVLDNPGYYQSEGLYDKMLCMWTIGSKIRKRYPLPLSDFQRFYTCLYTCMGPDATQPNDYIYGMMGLFQQSPFEVDTRMNPRELYLKVLETTQHQVRNLDFLSTSWINSYDNLLKLGNNKHQLPHWAVDYSHRETSARCLLMWANNFEGPVKKRFKASYQARASFQSSQRVTFHFGKNMFQAYGIVVSKIHAVGSTFFTREYENKGKEHLPKGFELRLWPDDWSEVAQLGKLKGPPALPNKPSEKLGPDADAWHTGTPFLKLFTRDKVSHQFKQLEKESKLKTWWTLMLLDTAMDPNTRIRDDENDPSRGLVPPKSKKEMEQLIDGRRMRYSNRLDRRKLFRTESGHLGLGAPRTEMGDLVVVLYGGNVPYIFRPSPIVQGGYMFVCDCFVQGIMDGQAMELGREQIKFDVYG